MSADDNKAIVLHNYAELNKGNLDIIDDLYAPDFIGHIPGFPLIHGGQAFKHVQATFYTAFPDLQETPEALIAQGDKVTLRETYRGTHTGDLQGLRPTGKRVQFSSIDIYRFAGGKIVELWVAFDQLGMLQQLGVIPPLG